jgi:predicted aspartyl protease
MAIRFSSCLTSALVIFLVITARGYSQDLPFRLIAGNRVVIHGTVAGGHQLSMLVDTGAECTIIDAQAVKRLQLTFLSQTVEYSAFGRIGKARLALVKDLWVGPISTSLACLVGDIPADGVDMILGLNVLARRNFGIDYERRKVVFGPWDRQGVSTPFEPESTMVVVNAQMCGKTIRFLVDTGASTHCVFQEGPVLWLLNYQGRVTTTPHMGNRSVSREVCLYALTIGSLEWKELKAMAMSNPRPPGWDAVLSVGNLRLKHVYFDFEHGLLSWAAQSR